MDSELLVWRFDDASGDALEPGAPAGWVRRSSEPVAVSVNYACHAVSLGRSVRLISNPSELFCETGMGIKRQSPFPWTGVAGYTDGSAGYIPTRAAYPEGGYEVERACLVNPEAGEMVEEAGVRLLRSLG